MLSLLLCLLTLSGAAPALDEADDVREHMKIVRDRRTSPAGKVPSMEALLDLGLEGPRQLARQLSDDLEREQKELSKDREAFLTSFRGTANRLGEARRSGEAQREIDELRDVILRNARDPNLTKERVKEESDPALERLTELTSVTPAQVYAESEKLVNDLFDLLSALDRQKRTYEYFDRARAALAKDEDADRLLRQLGDPWDPASKELALFEELERAALLATPMRKSDRDTLVHNETLLRELDPEEAQGNLELNLIRIRCGIGALRCDLKLTAASRGHSQDMKELDFFSHTSPVEGKETFGQRASLEGTSASAENIAMGQQSGHGAIQAWWYSPGHHRNMMAGHGRVGLGRFEFHWTQLFG